MTDCELSVPIVVENNTELYVYNILYPFLYETNTYNIIDIIANIEMRNKNNVICFINFTYKHTPNPNYLYYLFGYVLEQQQYLPGLILQQYSLHSYFYTIFTLFYMYYLCGYNGFIYCLLN